MSKISSSFLLALALIFGNATAQNVYNNVLPKSGAIQLDGVNKSQHVSDSHVDQNDPHFGEKCHQKTRMQALMESNSQYREGVAAAKKETRRIMAELESGLRATPPVYTIPVVFHVIHKGENVGSGTNISDAQLMSSIDALNRDYRRTNADGGIAQGAGPDTEIQFCLASVDPNGNPHSGINRVNGTSVSGYSGSGITGSNESSVKALSRWDNRYYLNIWVVSEINNNGADVSNPANFGGGTLGYAYLPTNPVTWNSDLDGIVALNLCVGNDPNGSNGYRLWPWGSLTNRTITHEVGHFLGLNHPFENTFSCSESNCNTQGDEICDTPVTLQGSGCNSPACPNTIVENYMDYTDESCQDMFTNDQTSVMRGVLSGVRNALVNTNNCSVSSNDYDAGITGISTPSGNLCSTSFVPVVTLYNYGSTTLTSVNINYYVDAQAPTTYNWSGSLSSGSSTTVTLSSVNTSVGAHTFTATTVSGTLNTNQNDQDTSNDDASTSFNTGGSGTQVTLTLDLDCFGEETTWEIVNSNNQVVLSGGPYVNNANGETVVETVCLDQGCYDFNIEDSYGDGVYGSQWQGCTINGNYTITDDNSTLVQMSAQNGDFGFGTTHNFCIGGGGSTTTCEDLATNDGEGFIVNSNDFPNFDVQALDNDQEAVATQLANAGFTSNWMVLYNEVAPGDTNWFFGATSWHANTAAAADNWFTFGPVTMLNDDGEIRWKHSYGDNDYRDGYELLVNTSGTNIADFNGATTLYAVSDNQASTDGDTVWVQQSVSLPAGTYAGQSLYFGFHHDALDMFLLFLDDIIVEGCESTLVGTNEDAGFEMNVFPNPSNGNFTFVYNMETSEVLNFELFNALGQQVWIHQSNGNNSGRQIIETEKLSGGVYTLMVKGETTHASERLILSK